MGFNKIMFKSTHDNWSTPIDVYNELDQEFNFNFDPCPLYENLERYYPIICAGCEKMFNGWSISTCPYCGD